MINLDKNRHQEIPTKLDKFSFSSRSQALNSSLPLGILSKEALAITIFGIAVYLAAKVYTFAWSANHVNADKETFEILKQLSSQDTKIQLEALKKLEEMYDENRHGYDWTILRHREAILDPLVANDKELAARIEKLIVNCRERYKKYAKSRGL
ncbi:MAG: hypothetical protein KDD56_04805 [Bdellovibrionales bacterium]|nr:hypothetical protein [Bdellovibrionales bacterium]